MFSLCLTIYCLSAMMQPNFALKNCEGSVKNIPPLTEDEIFKTKSAIRDLLYREPELGARFLRIAFHDCCSEYCDGCVDTESKEDLVRLKEPIHKLLKNHGKMTGDMPIYVGDLYHLAGIVAVEQGLRRNNMRFPSQPLMPEPNFKFHSGRKLCNKEISYETLPNNDMTTDAFLDFFYSNFTLSKEEAVAILGAHSLGGMDIDGQFSKFTRTKLLFNNNYYKDFTQSVWRSEHDKKSKHYFWFSSDDNTREHSFWRLNTDICLIKDIQYKKTFCTQQARVPLIRSMDEMENSSISCIVNEFASDQNAFMAHFHSAYTKVGSKMCPEEGEEDNLTTEEMYVYNDVK